MGDKLMCYICEQNDAVEGLCDGCAEVVAKVDGWIMDRLWTRDIIIKELLERPDIFCYIREGYITCRACYETWQTGDPARHLPDCLIARLQAHVEEAWGE